MEKLVRKEVYELNDEQMINALEKSTIDLSEEVANINDFEKLEELEASLMEEFDEYDKHIEEVKYQLVESVEYDGTTHKASKIKENIIYLLNQVEVDFRSTLGIYQAIRFWKTNTDNNIPYAPYESTLKILGTLKYKGENQFINILIINNWFASAHEDYKRDATYHNYLTGLHNCILTRMDELRKEEVEESENQE